MSTRIRISKTFAAALLSGGVSAAGLLLAGGLHAQTPAPAVPAAIPPVAAPATAAPAAAPGTIPTTQVPFYADWASSPHADHKAEPFNHWNKEGNIPVVCARCHSTPGFLDYLGADGSTPGKVDHPAPVGTVITCIACHNDKAVALTTVTFPSGVQVANQGTNTRCMTCHQGVESTNSVNAKLAGIADDAVASKLDFINVHYTAAGSMLFGSVARVGYEYPGKTYAGRFAHKDPYTHCTACHVTHTLAVKVNDCMACHKEVTDKASLHMIRTDKIDRDGNGNIDEGVGQEIDHLKDKLLVAIVDYAKTVVQKPIAYTPEVYPYFFNDNNGNGTADKDEAKFPNRYKAWTPRLMRAAYNYQFVLKDPGAFAHNANYATELLLDSLADLGTKVKVDIAKTVRP
jgi:Cytochrome c7 and related cytochrome c